MEDMTLNRPDTNALRLHGGSFPSWYGKVRLFKRKKKRKKAKDEVDSDEEPVYNVERIRRSEYPLFQDEVYLDHAGTTLFPRSAIESFTKDMTSNIFGNPHSESKSSRLSTIRVEQARVRALKFFNASPDEFDLVFVQNATAAIKLVSEILQSYSGDQGGFWYGYHGDAHTSLVGIREVAGAGYTCFDDDKDVEEWIGALGASKTGGSEAHPIRLFAYPGQSNMTGRRLPLFWPARIRRSTASQPRSTFTLLDAAALASTAELDLGTPDTAPDFTALSFYKIFGFPDLGALVVRRELGPMLRRRKYFGGGTVEMVLNGVKWHSLHSESPHESLEDGTLPFHNIVSLDHAIAAHERLYGSQKLVSRHTARLAKYLYEKMTALRHADGRPVCVVYKHPKATYGDSSSTGPTIAFNIQYADGTWVKLDDLEALAGKSDIHLRTGGVCNPGGIASALGLEPWDLLRNYVAGTRCGHGPAVLGGKPSGIARVGLGAMSNVGDVDAFARFVEGTFVDVLPEGGAPLAWTAGMGLRAAGVLVYPLDGAGAWRVPQDAPWSVLGSGLQWDKEWLLVGLEKEQVLTRETAPLLVLLSPDVDTESRVLRINLHDSLRKSTSPRDTHLCLPLEVNLDGNVQRPACATCASGELQMATRTVESRGGPVSARVCTSEDVVAFLSSALGIKCTVARLSRTARAHASTVLPALHQFRTIVAQDRPPRLIQPTGGPEASSTPVEAAHGNGRRGDTRYSGLESRSLEEALAEGMQANLVLTPSVKQGRPPDDKWVFMTVGRQCSQANSSSGDDVYHIGEVVGRDNAPIGPILAKGDSSADSYTLLRKGQGNETPWAVEMGQLFVLQERSSFTSND